MTTKNQRVKKILVISGGLLPPEVYTAGTGAIYNLITELSKNPDLEIHILTAKSRWSDPNPESWTVRQKTEHNLTFHFVKADGLIKTRILLFLKALILCRKFKFDLIHDYSSLPIVTALTGMLGKTCGAKTIQTICTVAVEETFFADVVIPPNWGLVDKVIVTSKKLQKKIPHSEYLPLGINVEKFSTAKKMTVRSSKKQILFLGSLEERKGAPVLARAVGEVAKKHPDVRFVFATLGKEGRDPKFENKKRTLLQTLRGFESNFEILEGKQNVPKLMANATIFVLPAIYPHGTLAQPQTLLEAMSMSKACVVSSIQKGDGLVEDGGNCLLFESGDPQDLAKKINQLLANPKLRQKLSKRARTKIVQEFDLKSVAETLHQTYTSLFI